MSYAQRVVDYPDSGAMSTVYVDHPLTKLE